MAIIEEETSESQPKPTPVVKVEPPGYNSDGYETASDTELNDNVSESENHSADYCSNDVRADDGKHHKEQEKPNCNEDEVIEKALALANVAKLEGNSFFKDGLYEEALSKYEFAIQITPEGPSTAEIRSVCYANRAACFSKLAKFEETVKECTKALELNPTYMKALVRRGEAHEKLEHYEESIADLTKILELDPSNDQARRSIIRLKPLADEKREKMKEEMIGKLKEMGNSILGRFGMSVDNFKAVKDPNTGSYSINFQR